MLYEVSKDYRIILNNYDHLAMKRFTFILFSLLLTHFLTAKQIQESSIIEFKDELTKGICISYWDTNGDGELSFEEAASVNDIGSVFWSSNITSFDEFQFFTGIKELPSQAFYRCKSLASIVLPSSLTSLGGYSFEMTCFENIEIPASVTSIGAGAFAYNKRLKSVNLPDAIESINSHLFQGCESLSSITLPSSLKFIGNEAFSSTSIKTLVIPDSVKTIYKEAFAWCHSLTSVSMGVSVKSIEESAFRNCNNLTTVQISDLEAWCRINFGNSDANPLNYSHSLFLNGEEIINLSIPNTITKLNNNVFYNCSNIVSVKIPASVTTIGDYAFSRCKNLINVDMSDSVTDIGLRAFEYCSNLTELTLSSSLESIAYYAFYKCISLSAITIPQSLVSMIDNPFVGCSGLQTIIVKQGNPNFDSRDNCNAIINTFTNTLVVGCQNSLIPNTVISIGSDAFRGNNNITAIKIPNSVISIGKSAFAYCDSLRTVSFPFSLTSIEEGAFYDCDLTSIISDVITPFVIDIYTFSCYDNATLKVPKGYVQAYKQCEGWNEFKIIVEKDDNTIIPFKDSQTRSICVSHWDIDGDGELSIDEAVAVKDVGGVFCNSTISSFDEFKYFVNVKNIRMSEAGGAFEGCIKLQSISLPEGLVEIGKASFWGCKKLKSISIPDKVKIIDANAFRGSGIERVSFPTEMTELGIGAFCDCECLQSIELPTGLQYINDSLFTHCINLLSVDIPKSVVDIGKNAFDGCCRLNVIFLPNSINSIQREAFKNCQLTSVSSNIEHPFPIDSSTFSEYTYYNATLEIPHGLKQAYKSCDGWNFFLNIIEKDIIVFKDSLTRSICIAHWDADEDGELSIEEAEAVTDIAGVFSNTAITSFDEFRFFKGVNAIRLLVQDNRTGITYSESKRRIPAWYSYGAFEGCTNLQSIIIPQNVERIGEYAFSGCKSLTSITLPEKLERIEGYAFASSALHWIIIPNSVKKIDVGAFSKCENLVSVLFSNNSLDEFGSLLFSDCNNLKSIDIPEGVTKINSSAFSRCDKLTHVSFPESLVKIDQYAFSRCGSLRSITIPQNLINISPYSFYLCGNFHFIEVEEGNTVYDSRNSCNALIETATNTLIMGSKNTIIPTTVKTIGEMAFRGCTSLVSINIPANVEVIKKGAFEGCNNLKHISVSPNNPIFDSRDECNAINNTATNSLVVGCSASIIPSTIRSISSWAFNECRSLEEIMIPKSINAIGDYAFHGCSQLKKVISEIENPFKINEDVFCYVDGEPFDGGRLIFSKAILYVPTGSKDKYKATPAWNNFRTIVEFSESGIDQPLSKTSEMQKYVVFNTKGMHVRTVSCSTISNSIDGLPAGIYIVNGKKVVKR